MGTKRTGRPSAFSQEIADAICERVATGEPVVQVLKDQDMPSHTTLHRWREQYPEFRASYAYARELSGEASEAEIDRIKARLAAGEIDANTARVLLDCEKWLAGKKAPRTHGDKIEVEHSGSVQGLNAVTINIVAAEALATPVAAALDVSPSMPALAEGGPDHG